MRAFITGSRGFVGHHLTAFLESRGDVVVGTDLERDVSNVDEMLVAMSAAQPDAIYHLAAASHVGDSWRDPRLVLETNVLGTAAVLSAARLLDAAPKVLIVSSAEVYGQVSHADLPIFEESWPQPLSPYGASKYAAEVVSQQAVRAYGQHVIIVRPFNHVGPGQSTNFFLPALAARLVAADRLQRETVNVGNLTARRDFTDVRDVVRAYRLLIECGAPGEVYNVCSGVDRSMQEIADALRDAINPRIRFTEDPQLLRPSDVAELRGSYNKLKSTTSWQPEIEFATTLSDIIDAARVESAH